MRLSLYYIVLLNVALLNNFAQCQELILVEKNSEENCNEGFVINRLLVMDKKIELELINYLNYCLYDNRSCLNYSKEIFSQKCFSKIVKYIYTNEQFKNNSINGNPLEWEESFIKILRHCENEKVKINLMNFLLRNNINDGIYLLWEKFYSNNEYYLKRFIKMNNCSFDKLAIAISVYHNAKNYSEQNILLRQLRKVATPTEYNAFINLINSNEKIDYGSYHEYIYGGI